MTNIPAYSTHAVAQHVFALLLELTNHVGLHSESVKARGTGPGSRISATGEKPMMELEGKTFGIVGYGRIGQAVARLALAFGMEVLVSSSHTIEEMPGLHAAALEGGPAPLGYPPPLPPDRGAPGASLQPRAPGRHLKRGVLILNTARGPLIDGPALYEALCPDRWGARPWMCCVRSRPARETSLIPARPTASSRPTWPGAPGDPGAPDGDRGPQSGCFLAGTPVNVVNP